MAERSAPPHSAVPRQLAVCGDGNPGTPYLEAARTAGRLVAEAGMVLLTGGMTGVMSAASEGARAAGGLVGAVVPGADPGSTVAPAQVRIATGAGEARNVMLVRSADAVIAIGGGYGTLSEIAVARKLGIPVFGYRTWGAEHPDTGEALLTECATIEAAVSGAVAAARR
ncbi:MAG TPA: TIGR00725 family protein [Candidatus Dormibacteraeota bacterium]|nr:TIGR00725 family protein [Candidatus Dormibacteraeota bacterium]